MLNNFNSNYENKFVYYFNKYFVQPEDPVQNENKPIELFPPEEEPETNRKLSF